METYETQFEDLVQGLVQSIRYEDGFDYIDEQVDEFITTLYEDIKED